MVAEVYWFERDNHADSSGTANWYLIVDSLVIVNNEHEHVCVIISWVLILSQYHLH